MHEVTVVELSGRNYDWFVIFLSVCLFVWKWNLLNILQAHLESHRRIIFKQNYHLSKCYNHCLSTVTCYFGLLKQQRKMVIRVY